MKILLYTLTLSLISCSQIVTVNTTKTLDFGVFTLAVPHSWKKINTQGIDSFVGSIITDYNDTIGFDLGPYSNSLTEREPVILDREYLANNKNIDTTEVVIVEDFRMIKDIDQYKKQNLIWDSIDGYEVKIVYPRKSGKGITGIYIDSLWKSKNGVEKFNLYASNLKLEIQKQLLLAVKTIKFGKPI